MGRAATIRREALSGVDRLAAADPSASATPARPLASRRADRSSAARTRRPDRPEPVACRATRVRAERRHHRDGGLIRVRRGQPPQLPSAGGGGGRRRRGRRDERGRGEGPGRRHGRPPRDECARRRAPAPSRWTGRSRPRRASRAWGGDYWHSGGTRKSQDPSGPSGSFGCRGERSYVLVGRCGAARRSFADAVHSVELLRRSSMNGVAHGDLRRKGTLSRWDPSKVLLPGAGLEPARPYGQGILRQD